MPVNEPHRQVTCLNINSAYYSARIQEGLHEDGHDLRGT